MATVRPQPLNYLDGAFSHAAVGVAVTDLDGYILEVNEAFCLLTGYSAVELSACDAGLLTHPKHRKRNSELIARLIAGEIPAFVVHTAYVKKGGNMVWVKSSVSPIRDVDGTPIRLLNICEDTTEQRAAQSAL